MLERQIENLLVSAVELRGGMCPKFVSPGRRNVPDRLILLPDARMAFCELKKPGQVPTAGQTREHVRLRNLGYQVWIINHPSQINTVLDKIEGVPK